MSQDPPKSLLTDEIESGYPGFRGSLADYRGYESNSALVEEYRWGRLEEPIRNEIGIRADSGWTWLRFWLRDQGATLDRVFDADGNLVGTHIDVTTPIEVSGKNWYATDLLLDIWLTPDGRIILLRERDFDESFRLGHISQAEAQRAETHVRDLTRWISAGEFPPEWILDHHPVSPTT